LTDCDAVPIDRLDSLDEMFAVERSIPLHESDDAAKGFVVVIVVVIESVVQFSVDVQLLSSLSFSGERFGLDSRRATSDGTVAEKLRSVCSARVQCVEHRQRGVWHRFDTTERHGRWFEQDKE
jgi:hypothetical protein